MYGILIPIYWDMVFLYAYLSTGTFDMRNGEYSLILEIEKMMSLCIQSPDIDTSELQSNIDRALVVGRSDISKSAEELARMYAIPNFMLQLLLQRPESFRSGSIPLVRFIAVRSFKYIKPTKYTDDRIVMRSCGECGSAAAALLSILRCGMCSYFYRLDKNAMEESSKLTSLLQIGYASSTVSQRINECRKMQASKPTSVQSCRLMSSEDIWIGSTCFPREKTKSLFPDTINAIDSRIGKFFDGDGYKVVLEGSAPLAITETLRPQLPLDENVTISEVDDIANMKDAYADLVGYFGLGFHCFGVGARGTETFVVKAVRHHLKICALELDFCVHVRKRAHSGDDSEDRIIWHRLPPPFVCRFCLYYTYILPHFANEDNPNLVFPLKTGEVERATSNAYSAIFGFPVDLLQMRHVQSCMLNGMADGVFLDVPGLITTDAEKAAMQGHSLHTHTKVYGCLKEYKDILFFRNWWAIWGCDITSYLSQTVNGNLQFSATQLYRYLCAMVGPGAEWGLCQRDGVMHVANGVKRNAILRAPCGSGKSHTALIPAAALATTSAERKMIWLIVPHVPLARQHAEKAKKVLSCNGITAEVLLLEISSLNCGLPESLSHDERLPHLLITPIHVARTLLDDYFDVIKRWGDSGSLRCNILDEVDQLLYEGTLREEIEAMSKLQSSGAPTLMMTGTLAEPLVDPLLQKLRMSRDTTDMIGGDEYPFPNVNLHIEYENSAPAVVGRSVFLAKEAKTAKPDQQVHIICREKAIAKQCYDLLLAEYASIDTIQVGYMTGRMTSDEKSTAVVAWLDGTTDVIATTYVVGYDGPRVGTVIIAGGTHNKPNISGFSSPREQATKSQGASHLLFGTSQRAGGGLGSCKIINIISHVYKVMFIGNCSFLNAHDCQFACFHFRPCFRPRTTRPMIISSILLHRPTFRRCRFDRRRLSTAAGRSIR